MKLIFLEVAFYLYKSIIRLCIECCCRVLASAPSCFFDILDNLQTQVFTSVAVSFENFGHCQNLASLNLSYRYYSGKCSFGLADLILVLYFCRESTCQVAWFSVVIPRCYKDVYVNRSFPGTARLWNSLSAENFPLT